MGSVETRIFDELFAYEERAGVNPKLRTNRFVKNESKNWYVNTNYIGKLVAYAMGFPSSGKFKIPGLSRGTILELINNYVTNKKEHELLPSTADVILKKRKGVRLRAFYTTNDSHRSTLKIVFGVGRNAWRRNGHGGNPDGKSQGITFRHEMIESLKHEVAVRETLASLNTINIPKVLWTDVRGDAFLLSEEMVVGRRFSPRVDRMLFRNKLLPQLRDTYLAYGVRFAPIQGYLPMDLSAKVTEILGERADGKSFVAALNNVIDRNGLAAVSLCHGGLRPGHVAVTNGEVYFLDWKRADEGLIIFDLLRTPLLYPRFDSMVEDIREIMTPDLVGNSYRFEDMLTVGIARAIVRNLPPRRVSRWLRAWRRHALSPPG